MIQPALGRAVYKKVAIEDETGKIRNAIKLSSNAEKLSTPGKKRVWRITNSREKVKSKDPTSPMTVLDVTSTTRVKMFHHPAYAYGKGDRFETLMLFLCMVDIFKQEN